MAFKEAHYFIRKPKSFPKLKNVIHDVLSIWKQQDCVQPDKENFVLTILNTYLNAFCW